MSIDLISRAQLLSLWVCTHVGVMRGRHPSVLSARIALVVIIRGRVDKSNQSSASAFARSARSLSSGRGGSDTHRQESEATSARICVHVKIPPCELFVKRWPDQQQPVQHFIRRVVQSGRRCKYRRCITLVTIITAKCGACWLIISSRPTAHIHRGTRDFADFAATAGKWAFENWQRANRPAFFGIAPVGKVFILLPRTFTLTTLVGLESKVSIVSCFNCNLRMSCAQLRWSKNDLTMERETFADDIWFSLRCEHVRSGLISYYIMPL